MEKENGLTASRRSIRVQSAIAAGAILLLYYPVLERLVDDWINLPDFSHGFLIPLVSLYLLYDRRHRLAEIQPKGAWSGLVWIGIGLSVLVLGRLSMEYFTTRVSLLIVIAGSVLLLLGKDYLKLTLFPIAYLIFMIPIPSFLMDKLTFPLQLIASSLSASVLNIIGIPVLREGNILELANTSLEVAEACSGIRSMLSLLALAVIFAYFNQKTFGKRAILVLSGIPIAIVANTVRVTGTGVLAHLFGDGAAQGFFHDFSGWAMYIVAFGCLLGVGGAMRKTP
jgi:exosortase